MNLHKAISIPIRRDITLSSSLIISKFTARSKWTYKYNEALSLPTLIIDLDGRNVPAVREYDETKDNVPSPHQVEIIRSTEKAVKRRDRLIQKQLAEGVEGFPKRRHQRKRDDALEHIRAHNPDADPPTVTAMDLMNYALLGDPRRSRSPHERIKCADIHMERLFWDNGIDYFDSTNMKIKALTENFDIETDGKVKVVMNSMNNQKIAWRRNKERKSRLERIEHVESNERIMVSRPGESELRE